MSAWHQGTQSFVWRLCWRSVHRYKSLTRSGSLAISVVDGSRRGLTSRFTSSNGISIVPLTTSYGWSCILYQVSNPIISNFHELYFKTTNICKLRILVGGFNPFEKRLSNWISSSQSKRLWNHLVLLAFTGIKYMFNTIPTTFAPLAEWPLGIADLIGTSQDWN